MDIRPYRIGLFDRIANSAVVDHTLFAGVASPGLGAPDDHPTVAVKVVKIRNRFWPGQPLKVLWQSNTFEMLRGDYDVLVCQEVVTNLSVWAIRLLHRRFGKRLVLVGFFYRPDHRGRLEPMRSMLRRFLRKSASTLIAYTERGRLELIDDGVDDDVVFVNGNTLDTARLGQLAAQVSQSDREGTRQALRLGPDEKVLVFLGRLRPIKKVDVAIEAVRLLNAQSNMRVRLVVIGDGELGGTLRRLEGASEVRFVGKIYDDSELARYLAIAYALVLPGSVGLTCVHGFANGLPCITTSESSTTQTPEYAYVCHGYNGIVLEQAHPELYATAIRELILAPALYSQLRAGALETAQQLDMDRMAQTFVSALTKAAGS